MRNLIYAAAAAAILTASPAMAAVNLDFGGVAEGTLARNGTVLSTINDVWMSQTLPHYGGTNVGEVLIDTHEASFLSGVAASGPLAAATSTTGLDVNITNTGVDFVELHNITSTITPAGLGFYIQDRTGSAVDNNVFTGYGANTNAAFQNFNVGGALNGKTIAAAGFTFDVYGSDYLIDGLPNLEASPALYSLAGFITLGFNAEGVLVHGGNMESVSSVLTDISHVFNTSYADAYAWGAHDIEVPLNSILEGNNSTTQLYYRATAFASTNLGCIGGGLTCLVAYSGFGDPVGRGGGVSAFSLLNENTPSASGCPEPNGDGIHQIVFCPQRVTLPHLTGGGAVPEPATWISMILGFGFAGAALRRRGVLSYS